LLSAIVVRTGTLVVGNGRTVMVWLSAMVEVVSWYTRPLRVVPSVEMVVCGDRSS
jgi:uncharacterized protein YhhL (DUF1145 family)